MTENETILLPVLPLPDAVVLPHMVVTTGVESDEARSAIKAARDGDHRLLLVPKVDGRYARVGTVAKVDEYGTLPNGMEVAVVRGLHRAKLVGAASETGGVLWMQAEAAPDPNVATERSLELAREYRASVANLVESRGAPGVAEALRGIDKPGQLADMSGYSPDLSLQRRVEVLEMLDVEDRLAKL